MSTQSDIERPASTAKSDAPNRSDRFILSIAKQIAHGDLTVRLPGGHVERINGSKPGPTAEISVHNRRFLRRLAFGGALGFAESYMDGDFDTPDLTALLRLVLCNQEPLSERMAGSPFRRAASRLFHLLHGNSRSGAQRNISYHYDLGNDFYEHWLDETMTYSCALFGNEQPDLASAQREKYRRIADIAQVAPGDEVLEIGCGWGGMATYLAGERGAKVTALTISREQHDYAQEKISRAGLGDRVEIKLQDYRDTAATFDRIVSIEMLEAVGERYWPEYFATISRNLRRGGRAALQGITIDPKAFENYRRRTDFIQRYIFPGGMLPTVPILKRSAESAGLAWASLEAHRHDYARTLAAWRRQFTVSWTKIAPMGFDERFRRMWLYYFSYCEAGFSDGQIDLHMIGLERT